MRRLQLAALCLEGQVRQPHRLALLHPADKPPGGGHPHRPQPVHGPHRGPLRQLRRPPRPRVQRRSAADRAALLHERPGDALPAESGLIRLDHGRLALEKFFARVQEPSAASPPKEASSIQKFLRRFGIK